MASDSLVIIPTYNEKENIEKMITKVMSLPKDFDLLIVDDGSPDGTAQIVKQLMAQYSGRLFIEERKGNSKFCIERKKQGWERHIATVLAKL